MIKNGLRQHVFIIPRCLWGEVQAQLSWIFCVESHRAAVKMSGRLWSHLEVGLGKDLLPACAFAGGIQFLIVFL